jgi:hypothetical protein
MRAILFLFVMTLGGMAGAQQRPAAEIDPNTKIQGGADLPGSGAAAGAGTRSDNKPDAEPRPAERRRDVAQPEKERPEDKPISERKPYEPEEQAPGKDDSAPRR